MKLISYLVLVIGVLISFPNYAETFQEGQDYIAIQAPIRLSLDAGKTGEVWSFFRYTCPGCYRFHPIVNAWQQSLDEEVSFKLLPIFQPGPSAAAFYSAELLDLDPMFHEAIYKTLHDQRKALRSIDDFAAIAATYGADTDEFIQTAESFSVSHQIKQGERWAMQAGVRVTPTMVVNGRYLLNASMVGSNQKMLEVVDYLLSKDKLER